MATTPDVTRAELEARARAWIAGDPDPGTAAELGSIVARADREQLAEYVGSGLTFGTAGLRAPVGPGPNRMNRAVVIRTTCGLARYLLASVPDAAERGVVVGFDARHDSERFARDVVGVLAAAGLHTRWFPSPRPTPLIAYAQKVLDAAAAVVITASHNPPGDNGYKVYADSAAQIVPPVDAAIAAAIEASPAAADVPRVAVTPGARVTTLDDAMVERYLADLLAAVPSSSGPPLRIACTPLHGVGGDLLRRALTAAGHTDLHVVGSQAEPDPTFPTVAFPNPEEPGAMDAVMALGVEVDADLAVANDPDADRFAVAVPDGRGGFRALTGNQIGVLLTDHLLATSDVPRPLVVSSIVSTPMVHQVAAAHGARSETTLTGFKWICAAARALEQREDLTFVYGFEEALGSRVGSVVRDKDGISAAVAFADLARAARAGGASVLDHLARLSRRHGLWVSHQHAVTRAGASGAAQIAAAMSRLDRRLPAELAGRPVVGTTDFRTGARRRPPWLPAHDLVALELADGRAMIRPSGTEPKCKIYVDLRADVAADEPIGTLESRLLGEAAQVARELAGHVGLT